MENKVVIKSLEFDTRYESKEKTAVYVNGKLIGVGHYGGEPEDNMRLRDYGWVEPLLENLAKSLGATVTSESPNLTKEEFEAIE